MKINLSFTFCVIVVCVYIAYLLIDSMTWLGGAVKQKYAQSSNLTKLKYSFQ